MESQKIALILHEFIKAFVANLTFEYEIPSKISLISAGLTTSMYMGCDEIRESRLMALATSLMTWKSV